MSRELDALVAEKVFGVDRFILHWNPHYEYPYYSTLIQDAWQVVEKLLDMDIEGVFTITETYALVKGEKGRVWRWKVGWNDYGLDTVSSVAETAPLAICLVALKAVGVEYADAS